MSARLANDGEYRECLCGDGQIHLHTVIPTPWDRHPQGCAFCPAKLLGLERDRNGDPLCQTCPHLRVANTPVGGQEELTEEKRWTTRR